MIRNLHAIDELFNILHCAREGARDGATSVTSMSAAFALEAIETMDTDAVKVSGECFGAGFEDFNFLHWEILRTREDSRPVIFGVICVVNSQGSLIVLMCIAFVVNNDITKVWTQTGMTTDCILKLSSLESKCPRRNVAGITQREQETL
jgi:hypothetical protein